MKRTARLWMMLLVFAVLGTMRAGAFSLALDSIAEWGKFPRFCVKTYRWGDKFFNSYDSTYVVGTGTKFNVKFKTDTWGDYYDFRFDNGMRMSMVSDACTSAGIWLTYLAVSVGYDVNVSKYFGGSKARRRFNFQFNCSLFAADLYLQTNDVGATIRRFGPEGDRHKTDIPFSGINNTAWGLDTYYFFNHKNYSQAAAFAFSKIQRRSSGSFYAGISLWAMEYNFDFASLPEPMLEHIPLESTNYRYSVKNNNYAFRLGYGYNWAVSRHWLLAVSESPIVGVRTGYINNPDDSRTTFSLYNRLKASAVFNSGRWFVAVVGRLESGLVYDKQHTMISMMFNAEASVGYRFNLW